MPARLYDEIEVEMRYNRGGKGDPKPYLVVSLEALEAIFNDENAIIAEEDASRLVAALCDHARRAGVGDVELAKKMDDYYCARIPPGEDDDVDEDEDEDDEEE